MPHEVAMFDWPRNRTAGVLPYIDTYLEDPQWVHAPHVVPLLAWLCNNDQHLPETPLPEGALRHLIWSLRAWSAFRGGGTLQAKEIAFRQHVPRLVASVRRAVKASRADRLADVRPDALSDLAIALDDAFAAMATVVKENESFVLPSKTAHLLFPSTIPAYDLEIVANQVLHGMLPARHRGRRLYATWLRLCWWVLQELRREGQLETAGQRVRDHLLLKDWAMAKMRPREPSRDARILPLLDSFVAEYALIGMMRDGVQLTVA